MDKAEGVQVIAVEPNGEEEQDGAISIKVGTQPHLMGGQNQACSEHSQGQGKPGASTFSVERDKPYDEQRKCDRNIGKPIITGSSHGIAATHGNGAGIGHDAKRALGYEHYEQSAKQGRPGGQVHPFFAFTL